VQRGCRKQGSSERAAGKWTGSNASTGSSEVARQQVKERCAGFPMLRRLQSTAAARQQPSADAHLLPCLRPSAVQLGVPSLVQLLY
jgi:hypothetical protein